VVRRATRRALAEVGIAHPPEEFLDATRWADYEALVESIEAWNIDADPAEVWPRRERRLSETERDAIRSGTREPCADVGAIDRLADEPVSLGVASNARHDTVRCAVEHRPFDAAATAVRGQHPDPDDWHRQKPDPDYVVDVLDSVDARTGAYVGDSETDVLAAHRAGIESAFLRRPHNRAVEPSPDPTFEPDTLHDLVDAV